MLGWQHEWGVQPPGCRERWRHRRYPRHAGIRFRCRSADADYYRDHHLKTIMKLYGKTIQRFELRKGETDHRGRDRRVLGAGHRAHRGVPARAARGTPAGGHGPARYLSAADFACVTD